jgi:hypothetical protein
MTFDQKKLALMLAWLVTVLLCGAIVSMTSGSGWVAVVGLALVPAAVVYRLFANTSQTMPHSTKRARRTVTSR